MPALLLVPISMIVRFKPSNFCSHYFQNDIKICMSHTIEKKRNYTREELLSYTFMISTKRFQTNRINYIV